MIDFQEKIIKPCPIRFSIGAILDFVLNIIFIPLYGVSGVSFSTMIAEFIVLSVQIYYTKTYLLKIRNNISITRYINVTIVASILTQFLNNIDISNFLLFMIKGIIFFGSYLLILFVKKEELILENLNFIIKKYREKWRETIKNIIEYKPESYGVVM